MDTTTVTPRSPCGPDGCLGNGVCNEDTGKCEHVFTTGEVVGWAVLAAVLAVVTLLISVYVTRNWRRCQRQLTQTEEVRLEIEKRNRLLPYYRLLINEHDPNSKLGSGAFGIVYKGYLLTEEEGNLRKEKPEEFTINPRTCTEVACKTIPISDQHTDILKEVEIMLGIESHEHVLGLKGLYIPKYKIIKSLPPESCFTGSIVVMEKMKTSLDKYR